MAALLALLLVVALGANAMPSSAAPRAQAHDAPVTWVDGPASDRPAREAWRRAVGPPAIAIVDTTASAPPIDDFVVVSWNVGVGNGDLATFVTDLREGRLTGARHVERFAILLQEAFRRSDLVPPPDPESRSAKAIRGGRFTSADIAAVASRLRLSLVYVPSMRNGRDAAEDRGNAILSTERLRDVEAVELPFVRQRRTAIGATLDVAVGNLVVPLRLVNVHLDPRGARLGLFGNPRARQIGAVLDYLGSAAGCVETVLGGDLNTVLGGADERAYHVARRWATGLATQDPRDTHTSMGRLDYVFFRSCRGLTMSTSRIGRRYGSDHHPVLARPQASAAEGR